MEEVDAWAATAETDSFLGQPTGLANTAWRSKRQRTFPAQLQQQHLQQTPAAPLGDTPTTQHDMPGHPTAPTPAAVHNPWAPNPDSHHLHEQPHSQPSLPAPAATGWHQKPRPPQQQHQGQQQQHLDPVSLTAASTQQRTQPPLPPSLQAGGPQYQHINSSSGGFGGAAGAAGRGHGWERLWGDEDGAQETAGFQQQRQQQQLWGDDARGGTDQQWWDGEQQQQEEEQEETEGDWSEEGEGDADPSQWQHQQQQQRQQQEDNADGGCETGEGTEEEEGEEDAEAEEEEEEEVQLESADFDLSRDEVIGRIEQLAFDLISAAAAGQLPTLSCVSTAASNRHMAPRHSVMATQAGATQRGATQGFRSSSLGMPPGSDDDDEAEEAAGEGGSLTQQQQGQHVLRLGSKVQNRSLLASAGAQANGIVRALQLLDNVHGVLRAGRSSTQRDVYYNLVGRPGFQATRDVSTAIHSVLGMLRVPRSALGISAASKGTVAGCLLLRGRPGEAWVDCRAVGPSGRPIPGEVGAVDGTALRSAGARFILVVEKDAVFQSLVESRLHQQLPCIIITGRGMPDVASRAFLAAVVEASRGWSAAAAGGSASLSSQWQQQQGLPVLGLVDWNPGGVGILLAYKYGCAAMGLESARYAVPSLCWLGVTSHMLQEGRVPQSRCHALSERDKQLLPGLKARLASCPDWVTELEEMESSGLKADIEALQHEDLMRQVQQAVLQGNYLR